MTEGVSSGASHGTWDAERLAKRRAIEALRSGVPNADAVTALGSGQSEIEDRFASMLDDAASGRHGRTSMLIGAGFGGGKSHLLTHLGHVAKAAGFVVSTVVISKETPLYDPAKVLRAAVESAHDPTGANDVLVEASAALDPDSSGYAELLRWLRGPGRDLDQRFEATLLLHQRLTGASAAGGDEDYLDAITRFWSGDTLPMPELRRQLKAVGEAKTFTFAPVKIRDLARQRLRFLPRLLRAAGHSGWVVLLDEVELIGRYSLLQRGRSYAELARWLGDDAGDRGPLVAVAAMTDDFETAVLVGKKDREVLPGRLRDKETPEYAEIAALAEDAMTCIERDMVTLVPPDGAELDRAYGILRQLHGVAHDWDPPDIAGLERLGATRMRQYVRAWINEWDLVRLDPDYQPTIDVVETTSDYREDPELTRDDADQPRSG